MGWKEVWEKYQVAAAFAEAGEEKMARHFLEESAAERLSSGEEGRSLRAPVEGLLKPSPAEG